ncbi:16828_t:CDS:2 [Dentiscutata erythropus]|uniref:16828_t:CDS:1 n=1 Tax=Dentiscutata erythropus TaxID=1348616 RepID=A0A9N9EGC1_9GLOM|nr:16828_t:CDS:2 [Dentiscutata erythropus]
MSSKYSALPDIDTQPDVYETPDTGEDAEVSDDGFPSLEEQQSEDIVNDKITVGDAVDKFKESTGEIAETDAEKAIRYKKQLYKQYVKRPPLEYEILPRDPALQETSLQKLRRLMYEVQELSEEVEKKKEEASINQPNHNALASQILNLQDDLSRINQSLGDSDPIDEQEGSIIKQAELGKKLIHQLQTFKNTGMPKTNGTAGETNGIDESVIGHAPNAEAEKNMVTYELFYSPETARVHTLGKTAELDERISALEKLVGTAHGQNFEDLSISITNTNLIAAVDKLDQHMQLLAQTRHLESVSRKAKTLVGELEKVNELKTKEFMNGAVIDFDTKERINYLFALLDKVDPLISIAPALVNRLKSLQQLHQEAAVFSDTINMISDEQNKIRDELKSLNEVSENLDKSFKVNEESIQQNISIMDARVNDLSKRLEKLGVK